MPILWIKKAKPLTIKVVYGTFWLPAASNGWQESHLNSYPKNWVRFILEDTLTFKDFFPYVQKYATGEPASREDQKGWWGTILWVRERRQKALAEWEPLIMAAEQFGKSIQDMVCNPPQPASKKKVILMKQGQLL